MFYEGQAKVAKSEIRFKNDSVSTTVFLLQIKEFICNEHEPIHIEFEEIDEKKKLKKTE